MIAASGSQIHFTIHEAADQHDSETPFKMACFLAISQKTGYIPKS